jgi:glyoxylase-like metal-dependent hydrolase (beta-lactamase superfamily II)
MNPRLYALNAGMGDSFFLEIDSGASRAVVLIDGGEKFWHERASPVRFAEEKGWRRIDLLILTHLHPDHIVGLLPVAETLHVAAAVLPYPPHRLHLPPMRHPKAEQAAEVFRMYQRLWELLKSQRTAISLRPPFGEVCVWRFGETRLRHLDPTKEIHLRAYERMKALAADDRMPDEDRERLLREFDALSNGDSSVWVLEHGDEAEPLVAFGADALLANWDRILEKEPLRPRGLKASHHGHPDALDASLLARLSPEWTIVTCDAERYAQHRDEWDRLARASGSAFVVTGARPNTLYLECELPQKPEAVEFES